MADFVAKVGCNRWVSFGHSLRPTGFERPVLTLSTQLLRLRSTQGMSGWWSRNQRCDPPQVLGDGGQNKPILGASRAAQSKPTEPQDALQVCEPHLDLFALTP